MKYVKYINYGLLLAAILLTFIGLYFWLAKSQIDYSAFYFALAAMVHSTYLHSTKLDRAG